MSGARLALSAAIEMNDRKASRALTTMCIGVGQGIALELAFEQAGRAHAAADAHGDHGVASRRGVCPRSAHGRRGARPRRHRDGRPRSRRR
jgi:hypothetical protein